MKPVRVVALTLLSVVAIGAQVLRLGKCPQPAVQANFDANRVNTTFFPLLLFMLWDIQLISIHLLFLQTQNNNYRLSESRASSAVHWEMV